MQFWANKGHKIGKKSLISLSLKPLLSLYINTLYIERQNFPLNINCYSPTLGKIHLAISLGLHVSVVYLYAYCF